MVRTRRINTGMIPWHTTLIGKLFGCQPKIEMTTVAPGGTQAVK